MARGDQLGRQWKILQALLYSRQGLSVSRIAEDLECHPRTVYRDLEALQIAWFPIYTDRLDGKNLWKILDDAKNPLPLPLDLTELTALYFSRHMVRFLKGTFFHDALESLFKKIKTLLPGPAGDYLDKVEEYFWIGNRPHKPYGPLNNQLDPINEALLGKKKIDMEYYTMSRKQVSERRVAPYRLWFHNDGFYVIGFCEKRQDVRIFALDRIRSLRVCSDTFEVPEDMDVDAIPRSSFGVFTGEPIRVEIRFSSRVAEYIQERIWHDSQRIHHHRDGSITFEAQVAGIQDVKFWVMSWGEAARVIAPEELRRAICSEAEAMHRMYRDPSRLPTSH